MHPSLLMSVDANGSAVRVQPVVEAASAEACRDGATCVRQSSKGLVLLSGSATPRMLRYERVCTI